MADVSDNNLESPQPDVKKRKRNRQALNCNNCRARKVQCDRRRPACTACVRRGVASECQWEDKGGSEPLVPQQFAIEAIVDSIRAHFESRISLIERRLDISTPSTSDQFAYHAQHMLPSTHDLSRSRTAAAVQESGDDATEKDEHEEANGAALALEVLAGGDFVGKPSDPTSTFPASGERVPFRQFVYKSIIVRNLETCPSTSRVPIIGIVSRRAVVDAFIQYIGSRERADKLLGYYIDTVAWVSGSGWTKIIQFEHMAFWHLIELGERDFDPAWLALYCITLAISAAAQSEGGPDNIAGEDLYHLSKAALDILDWRRKASLRVVACLGLYHTYMNFLNEWRAGSIFLAEAIKAAQALGYHKLGNDASVAVADPALPPDSLLSREYPLQIFWDIIAQDWLGIAIGREAITTPQAIDTALPRNFTDDQLEFGNLQTTPESYEVYTSSFLCWGKALTAKYTRDLADMGKPPACGPELDRFYAQMCATEDDFAALTKPGINAMTAFGSKDWRQLLCRTGMAMKAVHLHRPFMLRGYSDPQRFGRSSTACVEGSRSSLAAIRQMNEIGAPTSAVWFLARQSLSAITTIYIDVLRDADIGIDPAISDMKLVDVPYSVSLFKTLESSSAPAVKELGRKGQLLVAALEEAKEARRGKGSGSRVSGGYSKIFRRIAADVEKFSSPAPSSSRATSPTGPSSGPSSAQASGTSYDKTSNGVGQSKSSIDWLDDSETRGLLSSLGLINEEGEWKTMFPSSLPHSSLGFSATGLPQSGMQAPNAMSNGLSNGMQPGTSYWASGTDPLLSSQHGISAINAGSQFQNSQFGAFQS